MNNIKRIFTEQRISERFIPTEDVEIKVLFSSDNPTLLGKKFPAKSIDISKEGFGLETCRKLIKNSVLDLLITFKSQQREYYLTGNVRWVKSASSSNQYKAGIVLRHRSDEKCDLNKWRNEFNSLIGL